jgi:uncharacterized membrane protein
MLLIGIVIIVASIRAEKRAEREKARANRVDVTMVMLGLDWRARRFVQSELERIAKTADTSSRQGLVLALRQTALALRRCRDSWVYSGAFNAQPMLTNDAESLFHTQVEQARASFQHEIVRNTDGKISGRSAPELVARTEEGEGFVVVTLVVASRSELYDLAYANNPEQLRAALEALSGVTSADLVAMEVVWSPADENDRMSSVELEAHYPNLHRLPGATTAGKVYCTYCGGPAPAELLTCPHCAAPIEAAG